jgi:hypothetical protein
MLSIPLCIIISYKCINQIAVQNNYLLNKFYNICGGDMFRFLSVSHPQALYNFLNHKAEEVM